MTGYDRRGVFGIGIRHDECPSLGKWYGMIMTCTGVDGNDIFDSHHHLPWKMVRKLMEISLKILSGN